MKNCCKWFAIVAVTAMACGYGSCASRPGTVQPVARFAGEATAKAGWKLVASEAGKVVYIPFEGYYESKGGRIESPRFKLDKPLGENAYYRLTFTAKSDVDGYWWVDFFDKDGQLLPDVNSRLYASKDWRNYDVMVPACPDAAEASIAFVSGKGAYAKDVMMRRASLNEVVAWCDKTYAELPTKLVFAVPTDCWAKLPKSKAAIRTAKDFRIVLLGDSIMNDSYCGLMTALAQKAFPDTKIRFDISVRGSTGCWYYREKEHFDDYVAKYRPNLVLIGGISNWLGPDKHTIKEAEDAMVETIERCQAIGAEVVICTPPPSYEFRKDAAVRPFDRSLLDGEDGLQCLQQAYERRAAARTGVQVWDLTTGPCEAIARSGMPLNWFKRDAAHNDDRGKQLIAQMFGEYFRALTRESENCSTPSLSSIRPAPRPALLERVRNGIEVYGIVHWGLNTYTDREWGYGDEDPAKLNPDAFDAGQIVGACRDGDLQGLIVVAKHHDGFCLWPTKTTGHNVTKSPFRNGKGDYVREMEQACRRYGLKFGVYVSPWDRNNTDYATPKYVETFHAQIKELLSGDYGEVFEMWFDGANGGDGYYGGKRETRKIPSGYYRFDEVFKFVRELQPSICIFNEADGADYRWPGNEKGELCDDSCATIRSCDQLNYTKYCNRGDLKTGTTFHPPECDFPLRKGWFYHAKDTNTVRCGEYLMQRYLTTVGNGGTMNIGIAPDRHGRLAPEDVAALRRFGELKRTFFANQSSDKYNIIVLSEDISKGELVDGWKVMTADRRTLASGTALGIKRIRVLPSVNSVTNTVVEHTCLNNVDHPITARFYYVEPKILNRVMNATTTNGETDTAQWMTDGSTANSMNQ